MSTGIFQDHNARQLPEWCLRFIATNYSKLAGCSEETGAESVRSEKVYNFLITIDYFRADSRLPPSQWETSLQSNAVSHWLGANLESALLFISERMW